MRRQLSPERIIDIVCEYYGLTKKKLLSKGRLRKNVLPRQVCCYMIRYNTRTSMRAIGEYMQGDKENPMHYTTVIHSIRTVFDLMETDDSFERDMEAIDHNIKLASKINMFTREEVQKGNQPAPIVRMEIKSPADKVREKYL